MPEKVCAFELFGDGEMILNGDLKVIGTFISVNVRRCGSDVRHVEYRLVTSREYVSLQLQKQGGPCVLRLVKLSLKSGVIALCQKPVRNVRKEGPDWEGGIYREVSPRNRS